MHAGDPHISHEILRGDDPLSVLPAVHRVSQCDTRLAADRPRNLVVDVTGRLGHPALFGGQSLLSGIRFGGHVHQRYQSGRIEIVGLQAGVDQCCTPCRLDGIGSLMKIQPAG
jgi:hypothetical protein